MPLNLFEFWNESGNNFKNKIKKTKIIDNFIYFSTFRLSMRTSSENKYKSKH